MKNIAALMVFGLGVLVLWSGCGPKDRYLADGAPTRTAAEYVAIARKELETGIANHLSGKHLRKSKQAAEAALGLDPTLSEAMFWLGHSAVYLGMLREDDHQINYGLMKFRAAIGTDPALAARASGAPLPFAAAWYHIQRGYSCPKDSADIVALLQEAIALDAGFAPARRMLSQVYAHCDRMDLALSEAKAAAALLPESMDAQLNLADLYYRMVMESSDRKYAAAVAVKGIDAFNAALKLAPDNPAIWDKLAALYGRIAQRELQIHALKTALAAENTPDRQERLADTYLALGDTGQARAHFNAALALNPERQTSLRGAAYCLYLEERYEPAVDRIRQSLGPHRAPTTFDALLYHNALLGAGRAAEAGAWLVRHIDSSRAESWDRCLLTYHLGQTTEAQLLETARQQEKSGEAAYYIACRHWHAGDKKDAAAWFEKAAAAHPDRLEAHGARIRLDQMAAMCPLCY